MIKVGGVIRRELADLPILLLKTKAYPVGRGEVGAVGLGEEVRE